MQIEQRLSLSKLCLHEHIACAKASRPTSIKLLLLCCFASQGSTSDPG